VTASARDIARKPGEAGRAARRSRAKFGKAGLTAALAALALGCAASGAPPVLSPMAPLPMVGNYVPDDTDQLAHSLAIAALSSDRQKVDD